MFDKNAGQWVKTDLFGGKGAVTVTDLLGRRPSPPFEAVLACELAPGGAVGAHHQMTAHEIVICLEGQGTVKVDGEPLDMVPGAVAYLRLGATLAITNLSEDAPLKYLIVKAVIREAKEPPSSG